MPRLDLIDHCVLTELSKTSAFLALHEVCRPRAEHPLYTHPHFPSTCHLPVMHNITFEQSICKIHRSKMRDTLFLLSFSPSTNHSLLPGKVQSRLPRILMLLILDSSRIISGRLPHTNHMSCAWILARLITVSTRTWQRNCFQGCFHPWKPPLFSMVKTIPLT